jgi:LAO/AO transport system kinase
MAGIDKIWETILEHRDKLTVSGELADKRKKQALEWMSFMLDEGLRRWFFDDPEVKAALPRLRREVESGALSPTAAAGRLLSRLRG